MSALFWLFGLGALAVAFPFLFHLIRRTPRGQTQFSSLMFLKPSPPTLTRRSRLENLLLLLLRMAALVLIALAFMRPFFRGTDSLSMSQLANRRIAILINTSASMQRGDLWKQANTELNKVLDELENGDEVALLTFDDRVNTVVSFDATASAEQNLAAQQAISANLVREAMKQIHPGWARSDLGTALVKVADQLAVWRDSRRSQDKIANSKLQMVVISDLQKGSKTDALQSYQWPADVFVDLRLLPEPSGTNATVQVLNPIEDGEESASRRIRVRNFESSNDEQFFVNWIDANQRESDQPVPFQVPPGTSRVLELDDRKSLDGIEFLLSGDSDSFDNSFFVVPPQQQKFKLAYLGDDDEDDPEQMLFYLTRGLGNSATRTVEIQELGAADELLRQTGPKDTTTTIAVVASPLAEDRAKQIDDFLKSNGTVLVVLKDRETVATTSQWTRASASEETDLEDNSRNRYAMLAEIDFSHPLFAPFDSPRFNDFTKIRFWNHQQIRLASAASDQSDTDDVRVIARFDDGSPAVWQVNPDIGGRVIVFASGWHPADSQLALSTKFVPMLNGLLDLSLDQAPSKLAYLVNDVIELDADQGQEPRVMVKPDNTTVTLAADQTRFAETERPGIYRLKSSSTVTTYAVNMDRAESETVAIPIEQLEMFEINVGRQQAASAELELLRQKRDKELEDSQKIWKWLIGAAVILLIVETWLAGKTSLKQFAASESVDGESAVELSRGIA